MLVSVIALTVYLRLSLCLASERPKSIVLSFEDDYYHDISDGYVLKFQIGDQDFRGHVFPFLSSVVVIDSECGKTDQNCSRYCSDDMFRELYCLVDCTQNTPQNLPLICPSQVTFYNRSASATSHTLTDRGKWHARRSEMREMAGIYVEDILTLKSLVSKLTLTNFTFLSGLFMDSRIFNGHDALIGMAPGSAEHPNFISVLHQNGQLDNPVVSFSTDQLTTQGNRMSSIGKFESFDCDQWVEFATSEENAWILDFDEVEVMGQKFGKTKVLWNSLKVNLNIPQYAMDIFIREGVFMYNRHGILFPMNCSDDRPYIQFTDSLGQKLLVDYNDMFLFSPSVSKEYCAAHVEVIDLLSNYPVEWSIGSWFAMGHCHSYDFEAKKLSIGFKKPPA
ncbi:hypothetical protein M3Y95_00777600 [Aphelenchoides besseyi]|nr:hypothetical protein M3Y95_00777600 [Aphelenchoides besseyi]